jgi:hypothetical protein
MRVTDADGPDASYSIIRRSGEVVEVRQDAVLKLKVIPPGSGALRRPASWDAEAGTESSN